MAELRRIENRWTWQGLLQLAGLVFAVGGLYAAFQDTRDQVPKIAAKLELVSEKVSDNASRIGNLETRQQYTDVRYTEILQELREINRKLDDKADKR